MLEPSGTATSTAGCTAPPSGATTYSYNSQGERTGAKPASGTASTYTYDQSGELTGYTGPGGTAAYTYDAHGLRASKTVAGTTTSFTWDINATPDLLSDGATSYVYGPDDLPIEQVASTATLWYFHDAAGSTCALFDRTGAIVGTYGYDAYGDVTAHTGTASTPLEYTGAYTDGESGLVYLRARYYAPATAQFISIDPAVSLTLQPYAYASDSPLDNVDPMGLWTGGVCVGGLAAAIFGVSISACVVFDGSGDVGFEGTVSDPGSYYGTPSAGVSLGGQYSTADTIDSLRGPFDSAGFSAAPLGEGPSVGGTYSWGSDSRGCPVSVDDVGVGLGVEALPFAEAHGGVTDTGVTHLSNVPRALWNETFGRLF